MRKPQQGSPPSFGRWWALFFLSCANNGFGTNFGRLYAQSSYIAHYRFSIAYDTSIVDESIIKAKQGIPELSTQNHLELGRALNAHSLLVSRSTAESNELTLLAPNILTGRGSNHLETRDKPSDPMSVLYYNLALICHVQGNAISPSGRSCNRVDTSVQFITTGRRIKIGTYLCREYITKDTTLREFKVWAANRLPWYVNPGLYGKGIKGGIVKIRSGDYELFLSDVEKVTGPGLDVPMITGDPNSEKVNLVKMAVIRLTSMAMKAK